MKVLLGITGSVAATLTLKLKVELALAGHSIKTVVTQSALRFKRPNDAWGDFYVDEDEWSYYAKEKKVLHIDLVNWSDVLVIAPCTANTLSKIHTGISDNLLTCCVRAWPKDKKHIILVPAMNTFMMEHLSYSEIISSNEFVVIPPVYKQLFCGDIGAGAMANISDIIDGINNLSV